MTRNELGEFLRARRSRLTPPEVGMPITGARRVTGLRHEEVAVLARVSVDYYTRLEQGRETNPSGQVVDAIARALRLDGDAHWHLFRLAGLLPRPEPAAAPDGVDPELPARIDLSGVRRAAGTRSVTTRRHRRSGQRRRTGTRRRRLEP
ncbi:helix-turn-helix domain-containing protein [Nocardia sp. NPDC020380]|uniref:helix-turn-helix domain-containing protein n=1 Tax=Nocardia sp. NPDC020380 TaxID=3364309 RepID=UPI0037A68FDC